MTYPDCDAHYTCLGCGRDVCADERPSPGGASGICDDCFATNVWSEVPC